MRWVVGLGLAVAIGLSPTAARADVLFELTPRFLALMGGLHASNDTVKISSPMFGAGLGLNAAIGYAISKDSAVALEVTGGMTFARTTSKTAYTTVDGLAIGAVGLAYHRWARPELRYRLGLGAAAAQIAGSQALIASPRNIVELGTYAGPRVSGSIDWRVWRSVDLGLSIETAFVWKGKTVMMPVLVSGRASLLVL